MVHLSNTFFQYLYSIILSRSQDIDFKLMQDLLNTILIDSILDYFGYYFFKLVFEGLALVSRVDSFKSYCESSHFRLVKP